MYGRDKEEIKLMVLGKSLINKKWRTKLGQSGSQEERAGKIVGEAYFGKKCWVWELGEQHL